MIVFAIEEMNTQYETRPVVGFPDYQISNKGIVIGMKGKPLSLWIHRSGHIYVSLRRDRKKYNRQIHRLILEAFVGPAPSGYECLHRDGDPKNNALVNLRWGTRRQNMSDQVLHTGKFSKSKLTHKQASEIRAKYTGIRGDKKDLASEFGVHASTIGRIINGQTYLEGDDDNFEH